MMTANQAHQSYAEVGMLELCNLGLGALFTLATRMTQPLTKLSPANELAVWTFQKKGFV